jgi:hypothetical protein
VTGVKDTLAGIHSDLDADVATGAWKPQPGDTLADCEFVRAGFRAWGLEASDHSWRLHLSRLDFGDSNPSALLTVYAPNHAEAFGDLGWLAFSHSVGANGGTNFNQAVKRCASTLGGAEKDWSRRITYLIARAKQANAGANNGTFSTNDIPGLSNQMPFVFAGRVREGRTLSIYGPGGAGKTTFADGLVVSATTGLEIVPGWRPMRGYRTLVLDWDEGREEEEVRLSAICRAYGVRLVAGYYYKRLARPLADVADEVGAYIADNEISLVFVSPVDKATRSQGDNLALPVIELHEVLREFRTTNILIDHVTGEGMRGGAQREIGTTKKRDNVRGSYSLYPQEALCRPGSRSIVLENTKADALLSPRPKHAVRISYDPPDPDDGIYNTIRFDRDEVADSMVMDFGGRKLHEVFHETLFGAHMSVEEIARETGRNAATVRAILNRFRGSYFNRLPSGNWEALPISPADETTRNNVS